MKLQAAGVNLYSNYTTMIVQTADALDAMKPL